MANGLLALCIKDINMHQVIEGNSTWPEKWSLVDVAIDHKYPIMQKRLIDSAKKFGVKIHTWTSYPTGSRTHNESPYGFKIYAIKEVVNSGVQVVVWVDSAVWIVCNPLPFFRLVEDKGVVFFGGGCLTKYVNDKSLNEFNMKRSDLKSAQLLSGALFGFNFNCDKARQFFEDLEQYEKRNFFCEDNQPRPTDEFEQHRHDEAIASLLLVRHNINSFSTYNCFQGDEPNVMFRASKDGF